jgi:hypothetical protein
MQGAGIGINPWLGERGTEASHSGRYLCEPGTVLGSSLDKAGVHSVGSGCENAAACTVGVDGYIGGRIKKILWFGSEGDGMCCARIFVGPFYRVTRGTVMSGSLKRITERLSEPPPVAAISPWPTVTVFPEW